MAMCGRGKIQRRATLVVAITSACCTAFILWTEVWFDSHLDDDSMQPSSYAKTSPIHDLRDGTKVPPYPGKPLLPRRNSFADQTMGSEIANKADPAIINPHNFAYVINNLVCENHTEVYILIFVHSAVGHFDERMLIRKTWGSVHEFNQHTIRTIFLLALPTLRGTQDKVLAENDEHHDIIQEDFLDSYRNLTHKHLMGFKWILRNCPQASFIVKVDDDTLVNIFQLTSFLQINYPEKVLRKHVYCSVYMNQGPRRDKTDKWYVSREDYPHDHYPPYCEGFAYVTSPQVILELYSVALRTKYYWIDDVFITGIVAQRVGIGHRKFRDPYGYSYMRESFTKTTQMGRVMFLLWRYKNVSKELWLGCWTAAMAGGHSNKSLLVTHHQATGIRFSKKSESTVDWA